MSNNAERCVCCGREIPEGKQYCIMCGHKAEKKQTNYDRIRNMSVEELAEILGEMGKQLESCDGCPAELFCTENYVKLRCKSCNDLILKWLESEVTK